MINCKISKNILHELDQIDIVQYGQDIDAGIIYLEDLMESDPRNEIITRLVKLEEIEELEELEGGLIL